jgi:hypothetical protein
MSSIAVLGENPSVVLAFCTEMVIFLQELTLPYSGRSEVGTCGGQYTLLPSASLPLR